MSLSRSLIIPTAVIACVMVGFLAVTVNGQGSYGLQYNLVYTPVYPGGSTTLVNKFTNSGTVPEQVTGITITSDLGTFTASSGLPLQVPVSQTVELNMTEQIPSTATASSHSVTASIDFQYQDPSTMQWVTPNTSPLVVQGSITVTNLVGAFESTLFDIAIVSAIVVAVVAVLAVVLFRRRKPAQPVMGYPAPPPPPSPPPTQTS
jgi:hypothetical protein